MSDKNIVIEAKEEADSVIIWLHGLGADGHDFEPLVPGLDLTSTRFIFPNAPIRPVTVNSGMEMRSWYDIVSMDFSTAGNVDDIQNSVLRLSAIVTSQIESGIKPERIILAGFSQGGVIALLAGLTGEKQVAGILALSTYLPEQLRQVAWQSKPPILMCHGRQDPVIPFSLAEASVGHLAKTDIDVQFQAYDMQHQLVEEEISLIKTWLHTRLFP